MGTMIRVFSRGSSKCSLLLGPRKSKNMYIELPKLDIISSLKHLSTSKTRLANKEGVVFRFKQLVKDYWYVVIPVDLGTSVIWYLAILFCLKSGVDLEEVLSSLSLSEKSLEKLPKSGGYHALAFFCYNVISPIRHTVSIMFSVALSSRLVKTIPGYLRTSSSIAQAALDTGKNLKVRYKQKVVAEKIDNKHHRK